MLCDVCKTNPAERQLNKVVNGSVKTLNVCRQCFNRGGEALAVPERKCPYCGRTLKQINGSLIVGCARCYEVFSAELNPIIRQVQQL